MGYGPRIQSHKTQRGFAVPGQAVAFVAPAVPAREPQKKTMKSPEVSSFMGKPVAYIPPPPAMAARRSTPLCRDPHQQRGMKTMNAATMQIKTRHEPSLRTRVQTIHKPEDSDCGYETGDSDDDIYTARRSATKARRQYGPS